MKLGQILLQRNAITKEQLAIALWVQERWGGSLGRILLSRGYVVEQDLVDALSFQLGIAAVNLDDRVIPRTVSWLLKQGFCERYMVFPFENEPETGVMKLAMVDPQDRHAISVIESASKCRIRPYLAGFIELTEAIWRNHAIYTEAPVYYQGLVEEMSSDESLEPGDVEILGPEDSEYIDIRDSVRISPEILEVIEAEEEDGLTPEILEEKDLNESVVPPLEESFRETGQVYAADEDLLDEIMSEGEPSDTDDGD